MIGQAAPKSSPKAAPKASPKEAAKAKAAAMEAPTDFSFRSRVGWIWGSRMKVQVTIIARSKQTMDSRTVP